VGVGVGEHFCVCTFTKVRMHCRASGTAGAAGAAGRTTQGDLLLCAPVQDEGAERGEASAWANHDDWGGGVRWQSEVRVLVDVRAHAVTGLCVRRRGWVGETPEDACKHGWVEWNVKGTCRQVWAGGNTSEAVRVGRGG